MRVPIVGRVARIPAWMMICAAVVLTAPSLCGQGTFFATGRMHDPRTQHTATLMSDGRVLVAGGYDGSNYLSTAEIYDPATGKWTTTGSLHFGRDIHTATLLPDGRVLVVGGFNTTTLVPMAEIYDPVTGTWKTIDGPSLARWLHTATLLRDGRVLVAGGDTASAEIFDPITETWSSAGTMAAAHSQHTATLLADGRVLIAGGFDNGTYATVDIYTPDAGAGTWASGPLMPEPRAIHTATLLANGRVLVAAGANGPSLSNYLNSTAIFDPIAGTWSAGPSMAQGQPWSTSTLLPDGRVLLTGGGNGSSSVTSAELFDPSGAGSWSSAGAMATNRTQHTATLLPNGRVLVVGGSGITFQSSAEIYHPAVGGWTAANTMGVYRAVFRGLLLADGRALILGGDNAGTAQIYTPATGAWTSAGAMSVPRSYFTATLLPDGRVLVAGGADIGGNELSSAEIFNPLTLAWTGTDPMPEERGYHSATLLGDGRVFVAGGAGPTAVLFTGAIYDPASGHWTATASMPRFHTNHNATLLRDGRVLIAGGDGAGATDLYDPATNTWTNGGSMSFGTGSSVTLLPDGRVLASGGTAAELFDPDAGTWTATGSMAQTRYFHAATLLADGRVLAAGGRNNNGVINYASAEIYDPATGIWTSAGTMANTRSSPVAILLPDGRVLVAGGFGTNAQTAELYTPASATAISRRPSITTASPALDFTSPLVLTGHFRADSEASGSSGGQHSSANVPIVEMMSLQRERKVTLRGIPQPPAPEPPGWRPNFFDDPMSLAVDALPPMDKGQYLLTVTVDGMHSEARIVNVDCGVKIMTQPQNVTIVLGQTTTFSVMARGARTYQWQKDGVAIPGATGASYTTLPITSADAGARFRVVVTGACPTAVEISSPAVVTVADNTPPAVNVISPSGGEYWLLSAAGKPPNTNVVAWSMSDDVRVCRVDASLLYSNDSGASYTPVSNAYPQATYVPATGAPECTATQWACDSGGLLTGRDGLTGGSEPNQPNTINSGCADGTAGSFHFDESVDRIVVRTTDGSQLATGMTAIVEVTVWAYAAYMSDALDIYTAPDAANPVWTLVGTRIPTQAGTTILTASFTLPAGPRQAVRARFRYQGSPSSCGNGAYDDHDDLVFRVASTPGTAPPGSGLPATFGTDGACAFPGESTTNLTYTVPTVFPSGQTGSLYKVRIRVTDQAGNVTTADSANPFYIVQANPDSVKTLILSNVNRMVARQGISESEATQLRGKLQELANHPRVLGTVVDLDSVTSLASLYAAWDADPANPTKANDVLFGANGVHHYLRTNLLAAYTGVKYLILAGDDRIIPMARIQDRTVLLPEQSYPGGGDLSPANTTVGQALAAGKYLSDDPIAVMDAVSTAELDGNLFLPDLAVGRLVETPPQLVRTIATYISQDGILDLTLLDPTAGHKVLITGYDFLSNVATQMRARWKSALNVTTPDASTAPVDGSLVAGTWGLGSVNARTSALRTRLAGNDGGRYAMMAIAGHATHFEEGVPGTNPLDVQGLSTADIYGADSCATPTAGALDLAGGFVYAVGCHGGLNVPGSCRTDLDHSLDLPETMLARGAVAYVANSGYGWGLKFGIGYGARLMQIFTEQITSGATIVVGDAVRQTKQRYYLETPRYDPYDEKSVMQWTLFGLPMYAVKTGIAALDDDESSSDSLGGIGVNRSWIDGTKVSALPPSLTQLNLSFDFTAAGVYRKHDSSGAELPSGLGCPDANGCYYTLNGLVDRGTGSSDLPIQPYLIYDSRLSGTSQHGVLWKGGTYDQESEWTPVIAELVSNGGDGSNHGAAPRTGKLRPTSPRVVPGADSSKCKPSDLEVNSLTITTGEAVKNQSEDLQYSIARRYRNVDLEVFYFNNQTTPTQNCDRDGPSLSTGPFAGQYHQVASGTLSWAVPATDAAGVWRVLAVYTTNAVDAQSRGVWTPVELTNDGTGTFRANLPMPPVSRLTYVLQAVDNRGNVTWLDFVTTQLPSSGVPHGVARTVDVEASSAPTGVVAAATTSTTVSVTWTTFAGAATYDVHRSASGTNFVKIGSTSATTYVDNTAASGTAYLYAVTAVVGGNATPRSSADLATTVIFDDPGLAAGGVIRRNHIVQLRTAINAVRTLAGMGTATFTDPAITIGTTPVRASHVSELRTNLTAARTTLSLPSLSYTDPALTAGSTPVRATHVIALRQGVQ